jgi:TetR/AcrR family transcriptional regulator, cholesterol catabolism regulator
MRSSKTPALIEHVSRKASGRKPTQKSMATRQKILDAAAAIFAKNGYSLTLLSDIAERAGIHLTALYYYYDSKEALVADIISFVPTRAAIALQEALDALPESLSYRERIEAAFTVYLEAILKDDDYVRADHRIAAQVSPKLRKRALSVSRQINAIWGKLLEEAVAAGEVRADIDMTLLRMLMIGSMNWSVEWFRPDISPPSRLAQAMQTLFFEGAAAPSAKTPRAPGSAARSTGKRAR